MPTCTKCGNYFIRPPCPVCSPPTADNPLIVDSKESKGKTITELQEDLQILKEKLSSRELELTNSISDLEMKMNGLKNKISDLELTKNSLTTKRNILGEEVANTSFSPLEAEIHSLQEKKKSLVVEVEQAEQKLSQLENQITKVIQQQTEAAKEQTDAPIQSTTPDIDSEE